ncbi:MAG: Hsp70 family protein, partial [Bacteroidota bacterium]
MMINYGIDLGTTNSAIAVYKNGQVEILRNPAGLKQTLPSVVAFRKKRIQVGDKAREFLEKDPGNVLSTFKRKMGTSEAYLVQSTGEQITPISLSAYVLRELKEFVHNGEVPEAAVVTIPASFDTIQSNATKKAAHEAGFEEVVLLQEPIAASLAYANTGQEDEFEEGQWLVYDLGGGTFDIALIRIRDGEMKVVDHEGDNFLGGTDIDQAIVEQIIVPRMEAEGQFTNLLSELKSASGKYNTLFHILVHKAEEAKIQLSQKQSTEIEFEAEDDTGTEIEFYFELTRADLEVVLHPIIKRSIQLLDNIIKRNDLTAQDLKFVLMVGGSTYIPAVRYKVGEFL